MASKRSTIQLILTGALWAIVAFGPTALVLVLGRPTDAMQMAWLLLISLILATVLTNFSRVEELLLGPLRVKLREQITESQVLNERLRKQSILNAQLLLSLVQRQGRMGGFPEEGKEAFLEDILAGFDDLTQDERFQILRDWNRLVEFDIRGLILGGSTIPDGASPEQVERWSSFRKFERQPSAGELSGFLNELGALDDGRKELIEDLAYYIENRRHRRPAFWLRHGYEDGKRIVVQKAG